MRIFKSLIKSETHNFSVEHKNFNALLLAAAIFTALSCVFNFTESFPLILVIFSIVSSIAFSYLYYLSRFKGYYNFWITAVTLTFLLSICWFMNSGSIGSTPYIYLLTLILLIIMAKRHQQNQVFFLFLANISSLYVLEYFFDEELIHRYASASKYYSDMAFVFALVLFCTFFLIRFIKRSYDNERDKVNNQRMIIQEQNNEIHSSLTYASYIQKKILSDENKLYFLFSDYFVLFKPRDIVSGDFYWIKEKGNYSIVVAADCTGHGVPAAFLSILGISLLEEIIKQEDEELNAGSILEKLRLKFIAHLQKSSDAEYARDGMDVAICVVNYQDYTFQYAGANRPLVMIRNNQLPGPDGYAEMETSDNHTLYSFKSTKNTIGFNYQEYPFITHDIEFHPKDTFYLFSDGYGDQFDSKNKKKFKVAKLKSELLKAQDLPMPTQEEYLNNLHKKWKGDTPQTDDILVIGLRM